MLRHIARGSAAPLRRAAPDRNRRVRHAARPRGAAGAGGRAVVNVGPVIRPKGTAGRGNAATTTSGRGGFRNGWSLTAAGRGAGPAKGARTSTRRVPVPRTAGYGDTQRRRRGAGAGVRPACAGRPGRSSNPEERRRATTPPPRASLHRMQRQTLATPGTPRAGHARPRSPSPRAPGGAPPGAEWRGRAGVCRIRIPALSRPAPGPAP